MLAGLLLLVALLAGLLLLVALLAGLLLLVALLAGLLPPAHSDPMRPLAHCLYP